MTNSNSIQDVLFFPQMRPEKKVVVLDLTLDEKLVFDLLKKEGKIGLNALKEQTGLSNKRWDKAIKGLTKEEHAKVQKEDDVLTVEILDS